MKNNFLIVSILLFGGMLCLGQSVNHPGKGLLKKKTMSCAATPEEFSETIYKYSNGRVVVINDYYNTLLSRYEVIKYNQSGKVYKHISYSSDGEMLQTEITEYDSKQRILNRKKLDKYNVIKLVFEYDTLSRLIAENYYNDSFNPEISCNYYLYDYSNKRFIKKSYYVDCSLRSYEVDTRDNLNRKTKTEFFFNDVKSGTDVYKYADTLLVYERSYDGGERLTCEIQYIYNPENQLTETIKDGRLTEKNFYENQRLIRTERYKYSEIMIPRPPACLYNCRNYYNYRPFCFKPNSG